jgi:hypothetical protein
MNQGGKDSRLTDTHEGDVPIGDNRTGTPEQIERRLGFSNQTAA